MALSKTEEAALGIGALAALGVLYVVSQKPAAPAPQALPPPALPPAVPGGPPPNPIASLPIVALVGPDGISRVYWTSDSRQKILVVLGGLGLAPAVTDTTGGADKSSLTTAALIPLVGTKDAATAAQIAAQNGSIVWVDAAGGTLFLGSTRDSVNSLTSADIPLGTVLPILLDTGVTVP